MEWPSSSSMRKVCITKVSINFGFMIVCLMKRIIPILSALLLLLSGCRTETDYSQILDDIQENLDFGNISTVIMITDSIKKSDIKDKETIHIADSLEQMASRIGIDFSIGEAEELNQLRKLLPSVTSDSIALWEKKGWLEWKTIDGEKKYFKRAANNLILLKKFYEDKEARSNEIANQTDMIFRLKHTRQVIEALGNKSNPAIPVKMKVTYTITVEKDAVPEGEKIRCWLPWPKPGHQRQHDIKLLSTSNPEYTISPDTATHSTLYMEGISKKGIPATFKISYEYISEAQHYNIEKAQVLPYDKNSALYQKYTSEQLPDICFTDNIRQLADSITAGETEPVNIVRKLYMWFKNNIPWTGALEYSIMPNIPDYVCLNRRGDCGMQTFMFMSMLRYKGIPVKWQSGWMMPPGSENLHDWSEVYLEGTGWIPVDVSYDLQKSDTPQLKYYFMSGIDSYRLIVNDGVAGPLHPEKTYMRSEPFDFQRGEVEWSGGNLYFNKWDYNMEIEYIK